MPEKTRDVLARLMANKDARALLDQEIAADEQWLAERSPEAQRERTIEEHLLAIAPQEGFDIDEITDPDRHQIARAVLDAYLLGVAWLTRETDHGFKREDPLRVEVRDRRMT